MHGLIESTVGPALWVDFLHALGSRMDPPAASGSATLGARPRGGCARRACRRAHGGPTTHRARTGSGSGGHRFVIKVEC